MAASVVTCEEIRAALEASSSFAPVTRCDVVDVTGGGGACGAKFELELVTARVNGVAALERQRLVHTALGLALMTRIHALSMKVMTPEQAEARKAKEAAAAAAAAVAAAGVAAPGGGAV
jgi:BolA protein